MLSWLVRFDGEAPAMMPDFEYARTSMFDWLLVDLYDGLDWFD